ncbi:DUF4153 domain-containing protein [Primorskyibacter aestuariivivens]|uniref:DUF4153 domain-containing protein n=1 Tax=Primorskyibacter aestuariivivens TaxID=1888912 RepID=UPI00230164B8|nr:DUF4153 domain-containing protein [Primorskyibacter aestuariivivens]MDA7427961.1 DUF4153 domain-containing protein [Primorskyibacter aestuariivivens]
MSTQDTTTAVNRAAMALVGAIAGTAGWFFADMAEEVITQPRLFLFSVTAVMGFFAVLLGLKGPLGWARAALGAAGLAALAAGLLVWASLRFDGLETFFDSPLPFIALFLLGFIGTPFVSAGLQAPGGTLDYPRLFDTAWSILVRYLAGWLFVAVVWGIVFLSDALLGLVGITLIEDLIEIDPVPFALTGLFLGLALAIMHELRAYISPFLVLRLFRILLPAVVLVVGIFLIALPLRGFGSLFGGFSIAATLMAVAIAAITLITSAIDRSDDEAAQAMIMTGAARIMAVMLVPLCVAAGWAVWLRVGQYGWTPERVAAALSAAVLTIYALAYAAAVLRAGWGARIRTINLWMALGVLALSALWLTPLIHAESITTRSQISRFEDGRLPVHDLPLWEMREDWGHAGAGGLARLRKIAELGTHEAADELQARLARLDAAETRYAFEAVDEAPPSDQVVDAILDNLRVLPEGQSVARSEIEGLPARVLDTMRRGCEIEGDAGPGCVLILSDLKPFVEGEEGVLILRGHAQDSIEVMGVARGPEGLVIQRTLFSDISGASLRGQDTALLEALLAGDISIEPSGINVISIGGISILP